MALSAPKGAEDFEDQEAANDNKEKKEQKDKHLTAVPNFDESKLKEGESMRLRHGETIHDLVQDRNRLAKKAEDKLMTLATDNKRAGEKSTIGADEFSRYKAEMKGIQGPEEMDAFLKKVEKIKEEKAREQKEQGREVPFESQESKDFQKKFNHEADKNRKYIGEKDFEGFEKWAEQQRKKPGITIGDLEKIMDRFTGRIPDKDGLTPRIAVYNNLTAIYQRNGLPEPAKVHNGGKFVEWFGKNGREALLKSLKNFETKLNTTNSKLWTPKAKKGLMQKLLKERKIPVNGNDHQSYISELEKNYHQEMDKVVQAEDQGFTYFDSKMTVGGHTIRRFSKASERLFIDGHKDRTSLAERLKYASQWKESIDKEAAKAEELYKIYEGKPEEFAKALDDFKELDYFSKVKFVEQTKKSVEQKESKEQIRKNALLAAANGAIDKANGKEEKVEGQKLIKKTPEKAKKVLSDKTAARFKKRFKNFEKEESFKNEQTGKMGDLDVLAGRVRDLTSGTAIRSEKWQNITAYREDLEKFEKVMDSIKTTAEVAGRSEKLDKEKMKKLYKDYFKGSRKNKRETLLEATRYALKEEQEAHKQQHLENRVSLTKEQKDKAKEGKLTFPEMKETLEGLNKNMQYLEAIRLLAAHLGKYPEHTHEMAELMKAYLTFMETFGQGEELAEKATEEIDQEVEDIAQSDTMKKELRLQQTKRITVKAAEQSERRHDNVIHMEDRQKERELKKVKTELGTDEEKNAGAHLAENFLKEEKGKFTLEKGTGKKVLELNLDANKKPTDQQHEQIRKEAFKKQPEIAKGQADVDIVKIQKGNQEQSAKVLKTETEAQRGKIVEKIAQQATQDTRQKRGLENLGGRAYDLSEQMTKIRAKNKAKEEVEEATTKKIENAG